MTFRDNRGMASVALYLFAVVSILILVANFQLNYAVGTTSDAYDVFNSEMTEKNGLAQIVKESILAVGETAPADSANSLQTEIQNRLSSTTFSSGVTVAIDPGTPVPSVPANTFYPFGTPPASTTPSYFSPAVVSGSTVMPALAGMGNLLTSLAMLGPDSDLGQLTFVFDRTNTNADGSADPNDSQTYTVNANLFAVPLTNVDVVAYGLPSSGSIPPSAPAVPTGTFGSGVSTLVVTSNNPANDSTAYADLFASSGVEKLPYEYRNEVSFAWNAYEYLWGATYQNALLSAALNAVNADTGDIGTLYNFASPPATPIDGVSVNGNAVTVDCGAVTASIVAIVDPQGVGSVTVLGSASGGNPFILLVRNTAGAAGQTQVNFTGSNLRPAIFYLENSAASFSGDPQIEGALFLDPTTTASGAVTWFGHLSFYGLTDPLNTTLSLTMADSPSVKNSLAALAPRVLLVATTATR